MGHMLTAERLRDLLSYDPLTGVFTWAKRRRGPTKVGTVAGSLNLDGYVQIQIDRENHFGHRLAWLYVHGSWPASDIDHMNGKRSDNRIANLRDVPRAHNIQNQRKAPRNSTSGLLGVHERKGRGNWAAGIHVRRKKIHLGHFATAELAHAAYLSAKRKLHAGCTI